MYLAFYGLKEKPFNPTPDPRFLFLTPGHREALAQLVYGVRERKGFIALTGEVGTGKTTLVRSLLQRLDETTAVAYLSNAVLDFDGLLEYLLQDLGVAKGESTRAQRLVALNNFLIERQRAGQSTLLILDEAQNLSPETLEQVRLLSNFETPREKLLQILLVGQPELAAKLRLPELQQLKQRIGLRCVVPRLTPTEVQQYIRTRLRIAGARDLTIFSERAVARIGEYANGIPRIVNVLCDHCLVLGYAGQTRRVERDVVNQAIEYLEEGIAPGRSRASWSSRRRWVSARRWLVAGVAGTILGTVLGLAGGAHSVLSVSSEIAASVDRWVDVVWNRVGR